MFKLGDSYKGDCSEVPNPFLVLLLGVESGYLFQIMVENDSIKEYYHPREKLVFKDKFSECIHGAIVTGKTVRNRWGYGDGFSSISDMGDSALSNFHLNLDSDAVWPLHFLDGQ